MRKKVLHIRLTTPFFKNGGISKGFIANGWDVVEFDWIKQKSILGVRQMNVNAVGMAKFYKPDLIFIQCQTKGVFSVETINELMEVAPTVLWNFDAREPSEYEWMYELGKHITHLFVSNLNDVNEMAKRGQSNCSVMQSSCDYDEYRIVEKNTGTPQVVFIGNKTTKYQLSQQRTEMVATLTKRYGENFAAFGMGFQGGFCGVEKEREYYSNANVAIIQNQFDYPEYQSDRLYRALACGARCRDWQGNDGDFLYIDACLKEGHNPYKEEIRKWFIENHSYKKRIEKLQETLASMHNISFL